MAIQLRLPEPTAEPAEAASATAARAAATRRLLVTVREAAGLLRVGRSTLYELVSAGEVEVVHIGRSVRVPVDALEDLVTRLRGQER